MLTKIVNHIRGQYLGALALFVALGGTSYAAITLPNGSVGTKQLRNGSVTASKLARGAVSPRITLWAQIKAGGQLVASRPNASVIPSGTPGIERITWNKPIPSNCMEFADAYNNTPGIAAGSANLLGPLRFKHSTEYLITAFNGGGVVTPQNVNVIVVCP